MQVRLRLIVAALVLAGCGDGAPPPVPPAEVLVTEVRPEDVPIYDEFVGVLDGSVNAGIQARVQGILTAQNYQEGRAVEAGDVLFQIDPRPSRAALAEARARLAQAEANAQQAALTADRYIGLAEKNAISQQERDNAVQQEEATGADVAAQRAAAEQAQLNLQFTTVRSPIAGIAGLATAQVGDLVGPTTGVLTTVSTVDPIKAYFTVSDQRYVAYTRRWAGDPEARAEHERRLEFELILADGSTYGHKGRLFAVDTEVDTRTGAQRIAAIFPNPGNVLRRGQFVRVRMRAEVRRGVLLVPQRAVRELQGINQVVVVDRQNQAETRVVRTGRRVGQRWIIEEGLRPGDRVVVEGIEKARPGAVVDPRAWSAPAEPAP